MAAYKGSAASQPLISVSLQSAACQLNQCHIVYVNAMESTEKLLELTCWLRNTTGYKIYIQKPIAFHRPTSRSKKKIEQMETKVNGQEEIIQIITEIKERPKDNKKISLGKKLVL